MAEKVMPLIQITYASYRNWYEPKYHAVKLSEHSRLGGSYAYRGRAVFPDAYGYTPGHARWLLEHRIRKFWRNVDRILEREARAQNATDEM